MRGRAAKRASTRTRRAGCAAVLVLAAGTAQAATMEVYPYLASGDRVDLTIRVDGESRCSIHIASAPSESSSRPACRFELPPAAASLSLQGEYRDGGGSGSTHSVAATWRIVDFAGVSRRLSSPGRTYGQRMADFIRAATAFARENLSPIYASSLRTGKPAAQADIDAAEKRLGYALPADFASMQREVGAIEIGDHSLTRIGQVADADTQMRTQWGTPEEAMRSRYSDARRAALRASTLLFTEVGDGYGALRYRPAPNRPCGDQAYYEWISQEGGDDALKYADGRCMDFAAAFRWVLEGFLISSWADELAAEKQVLLIDTSAAVQPLALHAGVGAAGLGLDVRWQGPNGLWRSPASGREAPP